MSEKFVSVQQVTGQAWVRSGDGQLVQLFVGMQIPEDAIITTAANGAVQLVNEQGDVFTVTANQEIPLNEVSFQTSSDALVDEAANADKSTVAAVLEDQKDPFDALEDTESILNGGDTAGGSFTRLDNVVELTTPIGLAYPKPSQVRDDLRHPSGSASGGGESQQPKEVVPLEPEQPSAKPTVLSHETRVFESGLDAGGTEAATDKEFASGVFTFKSPDGVGSITLGGTMLELGVNKTWTVDSQGIKGQVTAQYTFNESTKSGEIRYTFELTERTDDVANQQELLPLPVVVTDKDGDKATGSVTIEVIDDAPIAHADTGTLLDGASTLTMDAASGVLANDQAGADGWGKVIGVEAGAHSSVSTTGVGVEIEGAYGKLTLYEDGSYTYVRNEASLGLPPSSDYWNQEQSQGGAASGGWYSTGSPLLPPTPSAEVTGPDVFTYTVIDSDGDTSLATLTIGIDGQPTINPVQSDPATGHDATTVYESGLDAGGTEAASDREFASGIFTFKSPDGVGSVTLGGVALNDGVDHTWTVSSQGVKGQLTAHYTFNESTKTGEVHYTFELTERTDDVANQQELLPLPVVVTDIDGDKATSTVNIEVIDDAPVALADTGDASDIQVLTVSASEGVLSNDVSGADGWQGGGSVVGVQAGSSDVPVNDGVGIEIQGLYGKLTLNADGSYIYVRHIGMDGNANSAGGGKFDEFDEPPDQDIFTYTIRDKDGSISFSTLSIDVDCTPTIGPVQSDPSSGRDATHVYEAGLDNSGTQASTDKEFAQGVFEFNSLNGVHNIWIDGHKIWSIKPTSFEIINEQGIKGVITAQYEFDSETGSGKIFYKFELTEKVDDIANEQELLSVDVRMMDLYGKTATTVLSIEVIDDSPIAHADTGTLLDGVGTLMVDAAGGVLANDQAGADGWGKVVGVEAGAHTTTIATGVGAIITGSYGTLTLFADGSYTYERTPGVSGTDVFTYTVVDGDGDLSLSTLTIGVDGVPTIDSVQSNPATGHDATTVYESGLDAGGTEAATDKEFASGVFTFKSPDGVDSITLGGTTLELGVNKTWTVDSQGIKGQVTAQYTFNESTKSGEIRYTFELTERTDDVASQPELLPLPVVVIDKDGDSATGSLTIEVVDDVPVATADYGSIGNEKSIFVDAAHGVLANDYFGVDGGVRVVGIQHGVQDEPSTSEMDVGILIGGRYGHLQIFEDGSYEYTRYFNNPVAEDVFTYTVQDRDGSLSFATLTINVDGTPKIDYIEPSSDGLHPYLVDEAGLNDGGSAAASNREFAGGIIDFKSPDGVSNIEINGEYLDFDKDNKIDIEYNGIKGVLNVYFDSEEVWSSPENQYKIYYKFELTEAVDHNRFYNNEAIFSINIKVYDSDDDQADFSFEIPVLDDKPTAFEDRSSLEDGATVLNVSAEHGVLANDQAGADGWSKEWAVFFVECVATGGRTYLEWGSSVNGKYGLLTMKEDGSYTYERYSNDPASGEDVFRYLVRDSDGNGSESTLTIDIDGVPVIEPVQSNPQIGGDATTVYESGLDAGGTEAATDKELASGVFTFKSPDGVGSVTLGGTTLELEVNKTWTVDSQGIKGEVTAQYTFNESTKSGEIRYTFELTERTDDVANQPELLPLPVVVTDRDGDSATGSVTIEIIDDTPVASADMGNVTEGVVLTVSAADGVLSNDQAGADHWHGTGGVVGVSAGGVQGTDNGSGGFEVDGLYGKLTLHADGSYTYEAKTVPNAQTLGEAQESFTYTVRDGDGDEKTANLVIDVNQFAVGSNENNTISGGYGNDVLIGDAGGQHWDVVPGTNYNIALLLDISGSMNNDWEGQSRAEVAKAALASFIQNHLLTHDGDINISLITFGEKSQGYGLEPETSWVNNSIIGLNSNNYIEIINSLNDLEFAGVTTPYAAGLNAVKEWFDGSSISTAHSNGYENITYFLTDGRPNEENEATRQAAIDGLKSVSHVNAIGISGVDDTYLLGKYDSDTVAPTVSEVVDFSKIQASQWLGNYVGDVTVSNSVQQALTSNELVPVLEARVGKGSSVELIQHDSMVINDPAGAKFTFDTAVLSTMVGGVYEQPDASWNLQKYDESTQSWINVESGLIRVINNSLQGSHYTAQHPSGEYRFTFEFNAPVDKFGIIDIGNITMLSGEFSSGAQIVEKPEDLMVTLLEGYKTNIADPVGDDVLLGGFGNDILFGDVINTDHLDWSGRSDYPDGSGLSALKAFLADTLYSGVSPADNQIHQYIAEHHAEFNIDNPPDDRGGHDQLSGGAGNDIIYGQGGNDILDGGDGNDILYGGVGDDSLLGGAGNDSLSGGSGNDLLNGGAGNDLIRGGQGDDILIGGDGDDIFVWDANDQGSSANPAHDIVKDFSLAGNDVLDFSDLLNNQFGDDLTDFLYFEKSGTSTVINLSTDGSLNSDGTAYDQQITLENVDLSVYGDMTDQAALIQSLVDQGKIIVD